MNNINFPYCDDLSNSTIESNSHCRTDVINANCVEIVENIDNFKIINPNIDENQIVNEFINELSKDTNNKNDIIDLTMKPEQIYTTLLDEIYEIISDNNQLFGSFKNIISKPDIKYENRKTFWYNFGKNCNQLNRSIQQLKSFFEKELNVKTSINDKSNLILRGKYHFDLIASTLKKYIKNYVQCSTCKLNQTEIVRNSSNRLDYLKCLNFKCNTSNVVIKI